MNEFNFNKKFVATSTGQIFYFHSNSFPNRPTVVCLHGLSANHSTWQPMAKFLHHHQFNVLAPDLRGHGYSDKTKQRALYRFPVFSEDLALILQQEKLEKIILVGYSFGGSAAIDYAIRNPQTVSDLVLISANHMNPYYYNGLIYLTPFTVALIGFVTLASFWQKRKHYFYYQPKTGDSYWRSTWAGLQTMPWYVNGWLVLSYAKLNYKGKLNQITARSLIVHSQHDPFVKEAEIKAMLQELPRAQVVTAQNPNHFIATEGQAELSEIILKFLKPYDPSTSSERDS